MFSPVLGVLSEISHPPFREPQQPVVTGRRNIRFLALARQKGGRSSRPFGGNAKGRFLDRAPGGHAVNLPKMGTAMGPRCPPNYGDVFFRKASIASKNS